MKYNGLPNVDHPKAISTVTHRTAKRNADCSAMRIKRHSSSDIQRGKIQYPNTHTDWKKDLK